MANENQVEELNKMKKQNSYTYWVKKNENPVDIKIDCTPQKLQSPLIQNQNQTKNQPSKWNTSGTWQQRKINVSELNSNLNGIFKDLQAENKKLKVQNINVEGEGHIIFSRGKKSMTYEFKIKINFVGIEEYTDNKGTVKFQQFNDAGERDYGIKIEGQKKEELKKGLKGSINNWIKIIEQELLRYKL